VEEKRGEKVEREGIETGTGFVFDAGDAFWGGRQALLEGDGDEERVGSPQKKGGRAMWKKGNMGTFKTLFA